jgi:hypothetical protein
VAREKLSMQPLPVDERPLGVLPDVPLTDARLRALRAIERFDLSYVRERVMKESGQCEADVERAIDELRRYFALVVLGWGEVGMMSPEVDHAWHGFILFTREYTDFCQDVFGFYLHHAPRRSGDPPNVRAATCFFRAYRESFGSLRPPWPTPRELSQEEFGHLLHHVNTALEARG